MLHTTIYYLRKLLHHHGQGEALQYVNTQYIFRPEKIYFDVEEFQQNIDSCRNVKDAKAAMQNLTRAVEIYRGDYMEEECFEWAAGECERLRRLYLDAVKRLCGYRFELGDYPTAELFLQRWLIKEPLDEEAHCRMMEVYARQRKHQHLVRQYETYQHMLLEELGAEPGKPVKLLFYKLLNESLG
jgi:two-component SAPR family response regulator